MRKAAAAARGSPAPSPQPGSESPFLAEILRRTGSAGGGHPRAPSSLSVRKDSPLPRNDTSIPGTPVRNMSRPTATRTSSSNTAVITARNLGGSGRIANRPGTDNQRKRLSSLPVATSVDDVDDDEPASPEPADASSVTSSSSSSSSPAQSRIIRRPPRFQSNDVSSSFADDDDDDDDAEPAFLPYQPQTDGSSSDQHDLSATLRGNPRDFARRLPKGSARDNFHQSQTSDSSASSAAVVVQGTSDKNKNGGPLSPRRTMELGGRNSSGTGKAYSRDSDGTPSMGSSFSDLDGVYFCSRLMLTLILNCVF